MKRWSYAKVFGAGRLITVSLAVLLTSVGPFQIAESNSSSSLGLSSPAVSPTPMPTPEAKHPNPVRRFFSWIGGAVTRPFRRREVVIDDPPTIASLTSSKSEITICPAGQQTTSEHSCSLGREVELSATIGSPEIDAKWLFTWVVTGGRVRGEGRNATWDLSELREGTYTATVEATDGNQHTISGSTVVTIARCSDCMFVDGLCPTIAVSCPSGSDSKQPVVFEAMVSGGDSEVKPTYTWSITAGKIISGQGTSKITVDASNLAGQSVTATVNVGGYNPKCPGNVAVCTVLEVRP